MIKLAYTSKYVTLRLYRESNLQLESLDWILIVHVLLTVTNQILKSLYFFHIILYVIVCSSVMVFPRPPLVGNQTLRHWLKWRILESEHL